MSVMDEYIKIVQDAITKYLKLVFERKFNKQICDSYIKTYIDVRYYNVNERGNHRTLRKEILKPQGYGDARDKEISSWNPDLR